MFGFGRTVSLSSAGNTVAGGIGASDSTRTNTIRAQVIVFSYINFSTAGYRLDKTITNLRHTNVSIKSLFLVMGTTFLLEQFIQSRNVYGVLMFTNFLLFEMVEKERKP